MYTRIKGFYPTEQGYKSIQIFGYSSQGLPGLEVIGVGPLSKTIKEKFLYLSKVNQLKIPLKRFVICVDEQDRKSLNSEDKRWLELPLLILYWSLAAQIPISRLDDCLCAGKVSATGQVEALSLNENFVNKLAGLRMKLISSERDESLRELKILPLESLFAGLDEMRII